MKHLTAYLLFLFLLHGTIFSQTDSVNTYLVVDERPQLEGVEVVEGVNLYLAKNIQLPDSINCFFTSLLIEFVVGTDGLLSSKKISIPENRIHCDSTVNISTDIIKQTYSKIIMDLLNKIPRLVPGKINGKAVPVKVILPIKLDFQE